MEALAPRRAPGDTDETAPAVNEVVRDVREPGFASSDRRPLAVNTRATPAP